MNPYYCDYSEYMGRFFPATKVQKISINAGNSCPNRDGSIGTGGCIYCDNRSFTPSYCMENDSVATQIAKGKKFFSRKYPEMKYLAYFQSFTNTYASTEHLKELYQAALESDDVIGIIIGTRPDCLPDDTISLLEEINSRSKVFIELGAETSFDDTLRIINRNHTWLQTIDAAERCHGAGLSCGLHLIEGLPGESPDMMMETVRKVCSLPVESIKFHHLQVIRGTRLHQWYEKGDFIPQFITPDEYLGHCMKILDIVPRHIAIERFLASSPPEMVVAPKWGIKNYEFTNRLLSALNKKSNIIRNE